MSNLNERNINVTGLTLEDFSLPVRQFAFYAVPPSGNMNQMARRDALNRFGPRADKLLHWRLISIHTAPGSGWLPVERSVVYEVLKDNVNISYEPLTVTLSPRDYGMSYSAKFSVVFNIQPGWAEIKVRDVIDFLQDYRHVISDDQGFGCYTWARAVVLAFAERGWIAANVPGEIEQAYANAQSNQSYWVPQEGTVRILRPRRRFGY
ncbi:hypothetical protein NP233_g12006 [Leucocoprinus birnbaumii]|uniref:DUF7770 domain-containing protein n=1 Tax=Leucocoprinus birnbaumii TaxID=56174 RepID=A0AAD5VJ29_9AGAR|nr:hypothetical protein NP233_g12006 [Leucocoprinus birnbaumii]